MELQCCKNVSLVVLLFFSFFVAWGAWENNVIKNLFFSSWNLFSSVFLLVRFSSCVFLLFVGHLLSHFLLFFN